MKRFLDCCLFQFFVLHCWYWCRLPFKFNLFISWDPCFNHHCQGFSFNPKFFNFPQWSSPYIYLICMIDWSRSETPPYESTPCLNNVCNIYITTRTVSIEDMVGCDPPSLGREFRMWGTKFVYKNYRT